MLDRLALVAGNLALARPYPETLTMMKTPPVAAIVLNWNRLEDTRHCCEALSRQSHADLTIWVVDNGSTGHTIEALRAACPMATVIPLPVNRGFAGGVNAGIRAAGESVGYYWLVNNDAISQPDALERLVATAQADPSLAAVGCARREGITDAATVVVPAGHRLRPPFYMPLPARSGSAVDFLCGASLLLRKQALEAIGLLDTGYFFFFEDADWGVRARQAGWGLRALDEPLLYHRGSASIGAFDRRRAAYYRAGYIRFLRKHAPCPWLIAAAVTVPRLIGWLMLGRWAEIRGTLEGWRQGWQVPLEGGDGAD